jgi:uncharacterized protein YkwD
MFRFRLFAALVALLTLIAAAAVALTLDDQDPSVVHLAKATTTTTAEADLSALVQSGVSPTLPEEERQLTEEAVERATSTTTTSTTLAPTTTSPPTTTTSTAAGSTAPPQTSPPTTSAPTTSPPTTAAGGFVSGAENDFASRINSFRGSNGLSGLSRDGSLDSYARAWAEQLAVDGALSHSNLSALVPPWSAAGENVGVGSSVASLFDALVGSAGHRDNMLGDFTHMGIGVFRDSGGSLWTAHVFTR